MTAVLVRVNQGVGLCMPLYYDKRPISTPSLAKHLSNKSNECIHWWCLCFVIKPTSCPSLNLLKEAAIGIDCKKLPARFAAPSAIISWVASTGFPLATIKMWQFRCSLIKKYYCTWQKQKVNNKFSKLWTYSIHTRRNVIFVYLRSKRFETSTNRVKRIYIRDRNGFV